MTFRQHHIDDLGHVRSRPSSIWLPVTTFVAITFLASAACQTAQGALGIDPALIAIVQFAPALGAVATACSSGDRPGGVSSSCREPSRAPAPCGSVPPWLLPALSCC
jgi:hypothetical protein